MRSRAPLFALLLVAVLFVLPHLAFADSVSIPFFGPIIPDTISRCAAGWGAVIDVINRIIVLLLTLAIVFVAPLMIAYAGFLYVVNPVNPSGISEAKKILTNTIVGIVVALAGWLIVDAIMVALYDPGTSIRGGKLGEWSGLVTGSTDINQICLKQEGAIKNLKQTNLGVSGISATGFQYLAPVSGDCSTSALIQNGISSSIATTMSCIAQQESSCNLTAQSPKSSAHGLFQVIMGLNDTGHNLNFPSCTAAAQKAGYPVNGNLNCSTAFGTGQPPLIKNAMLANACIAASSNAICNAQAAQWLYNHGGFTHWAQTATKCGV